MSEDTSIERWARRARRARQRRQQWRQHPVLKTAAGVERASRTIAGGTRRASVSARQRAYAYGTAYGPSMAQWARQRRSWLAQHVQLDTTQVHRSLRGGMSTRRRVAYVAARTRRQVNRARGPISQRMVRAAGGLSASDNRRTRRVGRGLRHVADRVSPLRYRCPRCRATYRNSQQWVQHECIEATGIEWTSWPSVPSNPNNPTHRPQHQPLPVTPTPQPAATSRNTTGGHTMSAPAANSTNVSGGHPAQIIGRGGIALGQLQPSTDQELIWTLERLNAACQMVGSGALSFAEHLDVVGVDPRVVEPIKGLSTHMSEGAAFPLAAHRLFWALYGARISPEHGSARAVKVQNFFGDQRTS